MASDQVMPLCRPHTGRTVASTGAARVVQPGSSPHSPGRCRTCHRPVALEPRGSRRESARGRLGGHPRPGRRCSGGMSSSCRWRLVAAASSEIRKVSSDLLLVKSRTEWCARSCQVPVSVAVDEGGVRRQTAGHGRSPRRLEWVRESACHSPRTWHRWRRRGGRRCCGCCSQLDRCRRSSVLRDLLSRPYARRREDGSFLLRARRETRVTRPAKVAWMTTVRTRKDYQSVNASHGSS